MADYLMSLVIRTLNPAQTLRPVVPAMFEPTADGWSEPLDEIEAAEIPRLEAESPRSSRTLPETLLSTDSTVPSITVRNPVIRSQPARISPDSQPTADDVARHDLSRVTSRRENPDSVFVSRRNPSAYEEKSLFTEQVSRTHRDELASPSALVEENRPQAVASIEEAPPQRRQLLPPVVQRQASAPYEPERAAREDSSQTDTQATVHVSIGRIEVRAHVEPTRSVQRPKPAAPKLSLDDYLRGKR